jgi:hypothetical protein
MKKLIIILALTAVVKSLFSQTVTFGDEIKSSSPYFNNIIGRDSESFYVRGYTFKKFNTILTISKYNASTMALVYNKEINLPPIKTKTPEVEDVILVDNKFIVFSKVYFKELKLTNMFAHIIDIDGNLQGEYIEIGEISDKNKWRKTSYEIRVSDNSMHILFLEIPPFLKFNEEVFTFRVFDSNLKSVFSKKVEHPYKNKFYEIIDFTIDNNANVYLTTAEFSTKDAWSRNGSSTRSLAKKAILVYDFDSNEMKEINLGIDNNRFPIDLNIVAGNEKLKVVGFYSQDTINYGAEGVIYVEIDTKKREILKKYVYPFDDTFINKFVYNNKKNQDKKTLNNMKIRQVIEDGKGGLIFISEESYSYQLCTTDSKGATKCSNYYFYNDIIFVHIDNNNELKWSERIPKYQYTSKWSENEYFSYSFAKKNNEFYFLFNDNPKNFEVLKQNPYSQNLSAIPRKKAVSTLVKLNLDSQTMTRELMFFNKENGVFLKPKESFNNGLNEVIIYGDKKGIYKFGKITF